MNLFLTRSQLLSNCISALIVVRQDRLLLFNCLSKRELVFDKIVNCFLVQISAWIDVWQTFQLTLNCISAWVGVWQDNNCCLTVYLSVNCGWTRLPTVVLVHIERELLFDKIVVSCVSKCKLLFDEMSTVILLCYLACIVVLLVILLYINCFTHYLVWMLYSNSLCWY